MLDYILGFFSILFGGFIWSKLSAKKDIQSVDPKLDELNNTKEVNDALIKAEEAVRTAKRGTDATLEENAAYFNGSKPTPKSE
jgi:hypothetical protein